METHQPTAPSTTPPVTGVVAPARLQGLSRYLAPTGLPWRKPRFELVLLLLVALAALSPVVRQGSQDTSRLCLSRAMVDGRLTIEPCANGTIDRSIYDGRFYSDKAPGLSVLAIPAVEVVRLGPAADWDFPDDSRLWVVRLLTTGLAFLLVAFAVGRVSEGLRSGTGGAALVTFALGTIVASLAPTMFGHVPAGAAGFAAFLLAWRRLDLLAGLAGGCALALEYQAGAIAAIVGLYVLLRGLRPLGLYVLGTLPPLLLLAAYDWAAFGSPLHLSYHYVANEYAADQASGLFGIGAPHLHAIGEVFVGSRGLLVISPVLVLAAAGLVLLWKGGRRPEAAVAIAVTAFFLLLNSGYFLPYGGGSPGPRFVAPAMPFLALGLAPAFARWRVATSVLAAISIGATTAVSITWAEIWTSYPWVWKDVPRAVTAAGRTNLVREIDTTWLGWLGVNRTVGAAFVLACGLLALALAVLGQTQEQR